MHVNIRLYFLLKVFHVFCYYLLHTYFQDVFNLHFYNCLNKSNHVFISEKEILHIVYQSDDDMLLNEFFR